MQDYHGVRALAEEAGAEYTWTNDHARGWRRSIVDLNAGESALRELFRDEMFVGTQRNFARRRRRPSREHVVLALPAPGHTACYISPYGEFYPCVQFPLSCGNVRQQRFIDIWRAPSTEGSALDPAEGPVGLFAVRARLDLPPVARGWHLWKEICADLPLRTVKILSPGRASRR